MKFFFECVIIKLFYYLVKCLNFFKNKHHFLDKEENYFNHEIEKASFFNSFFDIDYEKKIILEVGSGFGGYIMDTVNKKAKFTSSS